MELSVGHSSVQRLPHEQGSNVENAGDYTSSQIAWIAMDRYRKVPAWAYRQCSEESMEFCNSKSPTSTKATSSQFLENCGFQEQQNRHFTTTLRGMQGGPVRHTTCDHYDQYGRSLYGPEYGPPPHQYCCAEEWSNQHPEHQHSYENGLHDYSSVNPSSVHSYTMHSAPSMCAMPYLPPNDYPVSSHYVSSPSSRKHPRSTNESDSEETSEENYGYENGSDARHENNASDEENESRSSSSSSSYYPVKGESSSMLDLIAVAAGVSSDQPRARKRIIMNTIPHHHKRI